MKMTVRLLAFGVFAFALANRNDQTQIEKYAEKVKTYQLEVPGKEPITIIERAPDTDDAFSKWEEISIDTHNDRDNMEFKNLMSHYHNLDGERPRCYGPSCQDSFDGNIGPHDREDENMPDVISEDGGKRKEYDFSKERLQAINLLAAKLKEKLKADRYSSLEDNSDDDNGKVFTSWNKLKVQHHKHPYDDKDGWVTLEPVAWSTSKISKWKPNVKKHKPSSWNSDNDHRFPSDDTFNSYQSNSNSYTYPQSQKRPMTRPGYINNKLHVPQEYDLEVPTRPSWSQYKPQQDSHSYPSSWSPDEGRRPQKPNCDSEEHYPAEDDAVFYGISDSVLTDSRPTNFPYDYEALHQSQKRPMRRPTQVVYAGSPELDSDRASKPPHGDGQWVLLSTTKGYRNKKRQRSLSPNADDRSDYPTMTSHQAVALTVLPIDNAHTNMTTSHGGLLEVEKSFQTVEESKRDMDKKYQNDQKYQYDQSVSSSDIRPVVNRVVKRKIVSNMAPDRSTVFAAVGAGMVPATMAMVVPMMLGRRRRRRDILDSDTNIIFRHQ